MKGFNRNNRIVNQIDGHVELKWNFLESVSDSKNLMEIKAQLSTLPSDVTYSETGSFDPSESQGSSEQSTAFVCPKLGESFDHVIAEAPSVG